MNSIELSLLKQAQRIADMYADNTDAGRYKQLCDAIKVCKECRIEGKGDWRDIYGVLSGEGGIWEYIEWSGFTEEESDMWILEMNILTCICYLDCIEEGNNPPQDMEIQGDNIPEFEEFLKNNIADKPDYEKILTFWDEMMCY